MKSVLITGSGGLIGSEVARYFTAKRWNVIGIDDNSRKRFFGDAGDVSSVIEELCKNKSYKHIDANICSYERCACMIVEHKPDAIIHCAAQPSHDRAASIAREDFATNALGTFNMLEATRQHAHAATFVHMSTNKVYGDRPNFITLIETDNRFDFADPRYKNGIDESLPIDQRTHSVFGASKLAADVMAQEYGRYFDMNVGIFRGGCLTGPRHAGVKLHGFLSHLVKTIMKGETYTIIGYDGKQVRDNIHSMDVAMAFEAFIESPRKGVVYNMGGGKENSCSIIEALSLIKSVTHVDIDTTYDPMPRKGDHICYYTDMSRFNENYPSWKKMWTLEDIVRDIIGWETYNATY